MTYNSLYVFVKSIFIFIIGQYKNPKENIENIITLSTGSSYSVSKESRIDTDNYEVTIFEIEFTLKKFVPHFFSPLIPFFLGIPGFKRKLWLKKNRSICRYI